MKKVILDVDTGIDDALAIAYALQSPEIELLGITTGYGNVSAEEATRNTKQILALLQSPELKVFQGAEHPFKQSDTRHRAYEVHGDNGLGNAEFPDVNDVIETEHAVDFIISMVKAFPNEVTLITVATQTNVALALEKEPSLVKEIDRIVMMGGAVTVPGNVTPYAEANFFGDADSAHYVLQSGVPVTLIGLDVTMQTLLKRDELQVWEHSGTKAGQLFAQMCHFYMDFYEKENPQLGGCALHDPLAVGVAIDQSFVQTEKMNVIVEREGERRGQSVGEQAPSGIDVALRVDRERFTQHFLERVQKGLFA
ncbi:nucleosidase [Fictibacillus macauensis ZFHKF-1]|uniref:Nucleosidase n=1 Tax=Fictibacillus macauensis ZFHKF-1 TaxID=1196324 RepID=I8UHL2_9BACL|nr:nucleoside hydrolase [Fictibacillus macauensis]EIT86395.1 nucleosidase [Fictibacillus macauensis ZFHKF-1]